MFMCHAAELETRTDGDALWAASRSVFADAGLAHVIYLVSDDARRRVSLRSSTPAIHREVDPAEDPFLDYCCKSYDVTRTGVAYLPDYSYLPTTAQRLIRAARKVGFVSGFGIPTRLEGADRYGGFNLGCALDRDAFEARFAPHIAEIQSLCFLLHRRFEELDRKRSSAVEALSPREGEILSLIARGLTRKECAHALGLSPNTVAEYTKSAYRKLGVRNRVEAARLMSGAGADPAGAARRRSSAPNRSSDSASQSSPQSVPGSGQGRPPS